MSFIVTLMLNRKPLVIEDLRQDKHESGRLLGVVVDGETDAFPRALAVRLTSTDPDIQARLDGGEFRLGVSLNDGNLIFTEINDDGDTLPLGLYRFELQIEDFIIQQAPPPFALSRNQDVPLTVVVSDDPHQVILNGPVPNFNDDRIVRVLTRTGSELDGSPLPDWLTFSIARAKRKACLLNLLAKLRVSPSLAATAQNPPLIDRVLKVFFADTERIYTEVEGGIFEQLMNLSEGPDKQFDYEGRPAFSVHQRILDVIARKEFVSEEDANRYTLHSFRQENHVDLQAVIAVPPPDLPTQRYFADFDLDFGNPLEDLVGVIEHIGQVLSGKTDPFKTHQKLSDISAVKPFLNYDVR